MERSIKQNTAQIQGKIEFGFTVYNDIHLPIKMLDLASAEVGVLEVRSRQANSTLLDHSSMMLNLLDAYRSFPNLNYPMLENKIAQRWQIKHY